MKTKISLNVEDNIDEAVVKAYHVSQALNEPIDVESNDFVITVSVIKNEKIFIQP
jgi:hypothetical protein